MLSVGTRQEPGSLGHRKRLRRLELRASPEIKEALASGAISPRFADSLLYLPPQEQVTQLGARLAAGEALQRRSKIAVEIIRMHIDRKSKDLAALRTDLRKALSSPTIQKDA
jgi:hypothetical protein